MSLAAFSPRLIASGRISRPLCANHGFGSFQSQRRRFFGKKSQLLGLRLRAGQADNLPPAPMDYETALKLLDVGEGATFDEILEAKKKILEANPEDQELSLQVEIAYDVLLMESLSRRRAGKVSDSSVKYADVTPPQVQAARLAQKVAGSVPLTFGPPSSNDLAKQSAVFGALFIWSYISGLSSGSTIGGPPSADTPGFQLALGLGASLYFLRQRNVPLGKGALITLGGLLGGAVAGSLLETWLRVDIFPVLGVSSPNLVVSEVAFVFLWAVSAFIR